MFPAFFAERGHAILPSASLIPGGDPSVLFTTAGVQPLLPYLLVRPTRRQPPRRRRARRYGVRRQLARPGIPAERIVYLGEEHNWWTLGPRAPRPRQRGDAECLPGTCDCGRFVEVWNNVFMTFQRRGGQLLPLPQANVDTGMGLTSHPELVRALRVLTDHLRSAVFILGDPNGVLPGNQGRG
jgi:alanyl-tRNA synthetase